MRRRRKIPPGSGVVDFLTSLDSASRRRDGVLLLGPQECDTLDRAFAEWAHEGQLAPSATPGGTPWSTWVIKAGRGFGKTLAGAQWVTGLIAAHPAAPLRFALVGATMDDARRVMVEGRSGLLEVAGTWIADWHASLGRIAFTTGASAQLFSGACPHLLRGPEHHYAWCDELAKWEKAEETWDMLQLGLRLAEPGGEGPRAVVTTTPRAGTVLSAIMDDPATVVTGGPTRANPHLPRAWQQRVERLYGGTRLGRQELDGEMLPGVPGALWTVELIERCRIKSPTPSGEGLGAGAAESAGDRGPQATPPETPSPGLSPEGERGQRPPASERGIRGEHSFSQPAHPEEGLKTMPEGPSRRIIAVDPPTGDGTCGIVACAKHGSGAEAQFHILADHSVSAQSPENWAAAVAAAARAHETIEVVAEQNQGGKMVKAVLHTAGPALRIKLVTARTGKVTRAEPVAHLFEAGRAWLHGRMPELEAQMLGMIAGGGYEGPGHSPDRADAMVWGVSELMKERGEVRVTGL